MMSTKLTIQSGLAFLGGIAGGSLLAFGSAFAFEALMLATPSPGDDCIASIAQAGQPAEQMDHQAHLYCVL